MENEFRVIIVAGGVGKRMGKNIPKQFLLLRDKPIIVHTLERFLQVFDPSQILLAIRQDCEAQMRKILTQHELPTFTITYGGEHRTDTVFNALNFIAQNEPHFDGFVIIHDAVRPFITASFLQTFCKELKEKNALITVAEPKNSLRHKTKDGKSVPVLREEYFEVHTPQGFRFRALLDAYFKSQHPYTDDASLYQELTQQPVEVLPFIHENIKITTIADLATAEYLILNGY